MTPRVLTYSKLSPWFLRTCQIRAQLVGSIWGPQSKQLLTTYFGASLLQCTCFISSTITWRWDFRKGDKTHYHFLVQSSERTEFSRAVPMEQIFWEGHRSTLPWRKTASTALVTDYLLKLAVNQGVTLVAGWDFSVLKLYPYTWFLSSQT